MIIEVKETLEKHLKDEKIHRYKFKFCDLMINGYASIIELAYKDNSKEALFTFSINEKSEYVSIINLHREVKPKRQGHGTILLTEIESIFKNMNDYFKNKKIIMTFEVSVNQTDTIN